MRPLRWWRQVRVALAALGLVMALVIGGVLVGLLPYAYDEVVFAGACRGPGLTDCGWSRVVSQPVYVPWSPRR